MSAGMEATQVTSSLVQGVGEVIWC